MQPDVIRAVEVRALNIPLHTPFGISGGAQVGAENVLVTVELADGTRGYGEAAPFPAYNGETQAQALAMLESTRTWLPGKSVNTWRPIAAEARARGGLACGSAQAGLEMAVLDALCRQRGLPLWAFFGGAGTTLETDMTVTTGTVEQATRDARAIIARGMRAIKVKVGGHAGVEADLARVGAIHAEAPASPLILDGNAGLTRERAAELAKGLRERGITPALLEQWLPKDDLAGARILKETTGWLLAADESVTTAADAARVAEAGAAGVINIKLQKAGLVAGLDVAAVARAHGLGLMIGGNVESILAMTVSACFAAGQGGFDFADLDTPLFMTENPFEGGFTLSGATLSVAQIAAGHGVVPKR